MEGGREECPLLVLFDNRWSDVFSIDQTENAGKKPSSCLLNCMISLFQILNKNNDSNKNQKLKNVKISLGR
tara:strand:+ start:1546 stop:1758 length:213 start_codon:yes stop_codon:yes gene_type:complete